MKMPRAFERAKLTFLVQHQGCRESALFVPETLVREHLKAMLSPSTRI